MLRKDYILDRYSYISPERSKRPDEYAEEGSARNHPENCPFCPGREKDTPPEIGRVENDDGQWEIRWFKNKFPVLTMGSAKELRVDEDQLFVEAPSYGTQEVIVETRGPGQMADFSVGRISQILKVYEQRIVELSQKKNIDYVLVFKNKGEKAGASLVHSHSQVMAVGKRPEKIDQELIAFQRYSSCPYCRVLTEEKRKSTRIAFENDNFIAICPFAPRYNFEVWILPKSHKRTLSDLDNNERQDLAAVLKRILLKLKELGVPYCFYLQYAPEGLDFHFQIEVLPRTNVHAGFELSGGDVVVTVSPEQAAEFYSEQTPSEQNI